MDQAHREFIARACNTKTDDFPGAQPVSIERRHFPILFKNQYVVCEKSDGIRCFLACFKYQDTKYTVLINRSFNVVHIKANIPVDTLLDVEFMDPSILVYDAMMIRGESLLFEPLNVRLEKAHKVCSAILKTPQTPSIRVKQMVPLSDIKTIPLGEDTDGLIFTPVNEPVKFGTHETMFKWKPRLKNTVDFLVIEENRTCSLVIRSGEYITTLTRLTAMNKDPREFVGLIVECEYGKNGWSIIKTRPDKMFPNGKRTYERTIVNIREDIQIQEFYV